MAIIVRIAVHIPYQDSRLPNDTKLTCDDVFPDRAGFFPYSINPRKHDTKPSDQPSSSNERYFCRKPKITGHLTPSIRMKRIVGSTGRAVLVDVAYRAQSRPPLSVRQVTPLQLFGFRS